MSFSENFVRIENRLAGTAARLVAVSKTQPVDVLLEAYQAGCRRFGENNVQELVAKQQKLPADVEWHLIGHLQTNKVKYVVPFVHLIHAVDSLKLLQEIDRQATRHGRVVDCLLQLRIAREETKFGLSEAEAEALLCSEEAAALSHTRVVGLMGLATNTPEEAQISTEFRRLKQFFERMQQNLPTRPNLLWRELSMGMSGDYLLALGEGSTLVRVGSALFGSRARP